MLELTIRDLWSRKRRLIGMFTAVLVGVGFLTATLVIGDTMRTGFGTAFTRANAGTDAVVRSSTRIAGDLPTQQGLVDESLLATVAAVDGVAAAAPSIEAVGQIAGADGELLGGDGPPVAAGNWIAPHELNPWHLVAGRAPRATGDLGGVAEVVVDRGSAEDGNLHVGSTTTVNLPAPVPVRVVGVAAFGDADSLGTSTYVAFATPVGEAQLLRRPGTVTSILVHGAPDVSQRELVARLRPVLPAGVTAITGASLTREQRDQVESDFVDLFETILLVFAGISLLVAAFSIHNTFSIVSAQRGRESALLRALGASRRQVLTGSALQGLLIGGLASLCGLVVGTGLAAGLRSLLVAGGLGLPASSLTVEASRLVLAFAVGVLVTIPASVVPAVRASRVPPLAAIRETATTGTTSSGRRAIAGLLTAAAGVALTVAGASGTALGLAALGALLTFAGLILLGPIAARVAGDVIGAPVAWTRGITGSIARRNATRNPRTTAGTAAALMIGVAVITVFTVFGASIKASIADKVHSAFTGDLVVISDSQSGSRMSPQLARDVAALPEVRKTASFGLGMVRLDGRDEQVATTDPAALGSLVDLQVERGSLASVDAGTLAVSRRYADDHRWRIGTAVATTFADGARERLRVAAIYEDRSMFGDLVVPDVTWLAHATQPSDLGVFVGLAPGVGIERGRDAVQAVATRYAAPDVRNRDQYVASIDAEVDQLLAIVYMFLALAVVIAFMSIANTLSLAVHERTREIGLLRAVGQTRSQLRAALRWESVIVALFGAVGGLGAGVFLGWGLVRAVDAELPLSEFSIPFHVLVGVAVVAAFAGMLAALRPARRAARLPVLVAIAEA